MNEKLLEAAREYIAQGLSVIPTNGKVPAIPSWVEFQERLPNEKDLALWKKTVNATGLAAVTGNISGICVFDVDDPELEEGFDFYETAKVRTGRGAHYYFAIEPESKLRCKTGLQKGLDFKANGGLITLPPSLHVQTGKNYEWVVPFDRKTLASFEVMPDEEVEDLIKEVKLAEERKEERQKLSDVWKNYKPSYSDITHGMVQEARDVLIDDILPEGLKLERSGRARMVALCPLHEEKTPSFTLFLNSNSFYCFGCEKGGDVIDLVMALRDCKFKEAVLWLYRGEWDKDEHHDGD